MMTETETKHVPEQEVIVVGAGPAGAIAAVVARAGIRVRVLDGRGFPASSSVAIP